MARGGRRRWWCHFVLDWRSKITRNFGGSELSLLYIYLLYIFTSSPLFLLPLRWEHLSPEQIKCFEELSKHVESGDITKELEKEVLVMTTSPYSHPPNHIDEQRREFDRRYSESNETKEHCTSPSSPSLLNHVGSVPIQFNVRNACSLIRIIRSLLI